MKDYFDWAVLPEKEKQPFLTLAKQQLVSQGFVRSVPDPPYIDTMAGKLYENAAKAFEETAEAETSLGSASRYSQHSLRK